MRPLRIYTLALICALSFVLEAPAQEADRRYKNLKVLPEDISEDALNRVRSDIRSRPA